MSIEKLKELLDSGAITQEEYDTMAKAIDVDPEPNTDPEPKTEPNTDPEPIDYDKLEKIIQSKVDKATAKLGKEKADLQKQLERERKARMTDEELKQIELDEKTKAIEEREKAIADKENRIYAIKALKDAGLDDGSGTSMALVDFVMGEDEADIDEKVQAFKEIFNKAVDKAVTAEVNKRFKDNGYTPKKGDNLNGGVNPWKKGQENITQQMNIEITDPELAAKLKAAAGVK